MIPGDVSALITEAWKTLRIPFRAVLATAMFATAADAALSPYLLKDLNTNTETGVNADVWPVIDGVAYLSAWDVEHGRELWRSDGTAEGTWLVKDIRAGIESSAPAYFVVWDRALWFTATVESNRVALFRSDGTRDGTILIRDGFFGYPNLAAGNLAVAGNTLFFAGNDGRTGLELWKSDGTPEGTILLKDIGPGAFGSSPSSITALGNAVLFRATDANGAELWRSDGTPQGTFLLKDFVPGPGSGNPSGFVVLGTNLLVAARNNTELWKSDGTTNGTKLLSTFGTALPFSSIEYLTLVGTQVFFRAPINGDVELWRSDGTSGGTLRVADLFSGGSSYPGSITDFNGIALFSARDEAGDQLWRSDGTSPGTWPVLGTNGARIRAPSWLRTAGDCVYFSASDSNGSELWRTDGTSNHTYMIKDIVPGQGSSSPTVGAVLDGFSLFAASTPEFGTELWRTDGTTAGTVMVKDINSETGGANPSSAARIGETLFFGTGQAALWKTDGTPEGTEEVMRLPSDGLRYLSELTAFSNLLFFTVDAKVSTNGQELWISDGTSNGTRLLKDIYPGQTGSYPRYFTPAGSRLFFAATGTNGTELWRTDGTDAGTLEVKDLNPGPNGSFPSDLTEYHGQLFFHASHTNGRSGLWSSDGTSTGTVLVAEFTGIAKLIKAADQLLVFALTATNVALWSSRGTPETTSFVALVPPGTIQIGAAPIEVIARSDAALFAWGDNSTGTELWLTDGTTSGTRLLKDISPGTSSSYPRLFFNDGNLTYFQANDGVHGIEIWRTDGTESGTRLLRDINPGPAGSVSSLGFSRMADVNGLVFFWAFEPGHGTELWMTDGTEAGTTLVADLNPGKDVLPNPNAPSLILTGVNGRLYFTADDGRSECSPPSAFECHAAKPRNRAALNR